MRFRPSNPMNVYSTMIEKENFEQEQKDKKEFYDSLKQIAESAKMQSEIALKQSKKADVKGWIAVIFSAIALFFDFTIDRTEIIDYISQILQLFS